jgi:hypothetical protein
MNVFVGQPFSHDRLHRFGLRSFLRGQPRAIKHVQEIGVTAGVQLIGPDHFDTAPAEEIDNGAMQHSCAHLGFDVVSDDR